MDFNSFFTTDSSLVSSSSHSSSIFPPPPSSSSNFSTLSILDKEHMFDKVVTPSDVGKLNRLVIPKQHAQKYFPLEKKTSGTWTVLENDSSSDKGLLLNFEEDRTDGKIWRFRYSYWSSSQSYVITKGWSRFVKDKKLNSGDVISFYRAKDRLFIDWRYQIHHSQHQQQNIYFNQHRYWSAPGSLSSPNLYYFNQPSNIMAMDHNSLLGRPPLIVGGVAYEPDADQGMNIMRSEAQHEIVMRNNGIMSTRRTADDDDKDEDEEDGETEEEAAAETHEFLDSEAAPVHKGGEMKQLRLFGVNMKCGAPPPCR